MDMSLGDEGEKGDATVTDCRRRRPPLDGVVAWRVSGGGGGVEETGQEADGRRWCADKGEGSGDGLGGGAQAAVEAEIGGGPEDGEGIGEVGVVVPATKRIGGGPGGVASLAAAGNRREEDIRARGQGRRRVIREWEEGLRGVGNARRGRVGAWPRGGSAGLGRSGGAVGDGRRSHPFDLM